jgi:hypothetical protein
VEAVVVGIEVAAVVQVVCSQTTWRLLRVLHTRLPLELAALLPQMELIQPRLD